MKGALEFICRMEGWRMLIDFFDSLLRLESFAVLFPQPISALEQCQPWKVFRRLLAHSLLLAPQRIPNITICCMPWVRVDKVDLLYGLCYGELRGTEPLFTFPFDKVGQIVL